MDDIREALVAAMRENENNSGTSEVHSKLLDATEKAEQLGQLLIDAHDLIEQLSEPRHISTPLRDERDSWFRRHLRILRPTPQPHALPVYDINGRSYYRDERLGEFRAVDNPHDVIPLDDATDQH